MSEIDEKEIKRRFEIISRFELSPEMTACDLERVKNSLTEQVSKQPAARQGIWRIILKSRITRLTAAVTIVIAVLVCRSYFGGKVDLTTIAFAEITEAMRNVPWMHVKAKIDAPQGKGQIEEWICFEKSIEITKRINGSISYRDEGQDTMYVYDPVSNTVTISSMSDRYAAPRRTPMPDSPSGIIDTLIENLKEKGKALLSVSYDEIDRQPVKILHAVSTIQGESVINQDITIIINAESMLPIRMDTVVTIEGGDQLGVVHVDFDYPSEGPKDIYSLGIPQDAEVIDRRPKPGIESEINYKYVTNPENSAQEMLILYGGVNIDLVKIPEGQFLMGSPEDEIGYPERLLQIYRKSKKERVRQLKHPSNEDPQHLVKISRAFNMSKYEITCRQFRCFRSEFRKMPGFVGPIDGRQTKIFMDQDNQPACVSLNDATEFCGWLSEKTGLKVRLPSEAEWEYACRAGTQSSFYWGDSEEDAGKYANLADQAYEKVAPGNSYTLNTDDGNVSLAPVGQYLPNRFGLYDMIGNASEWVEGIYSENAYGIDPDNKYFDENNEDNQQQYCRGGGWSADIINSRCASRWYVPQDVVSMTSRSHIGFRILIEEPL
jgi:sulfatase modifying factor 1